MIRRGSAAKFHTRRVAWLKPRLDRYRDVPGINDDVTNVGSTALATLHADMTAEKLIPGSMMNVQRDMIRRLLSELRGEHVKQGHW